LVVPGAKAVELEVVCAVLRDHLRAGRAEPLVVSRPGERQPAGDGLEAHLAAEFDPCRLAWVSAPRRKPHSDAGAVLLRRRGGRGESPGIPAMELPNQRFVVPFEIVHKGVDLHVAFLDQLIADGTDVSQPERLLAHPELLRFRNVLVQSLPPVFAADLGAVVVVEEGPIRTAAFSLQVIAKCASHLAVRSHADDRTVKGIPADEPARLLFDRHANSATLDRSSALVRLHDLALRQRGGACQENVARRQGAAIDASSESDAGCADIPKHDLPCCGNAGTVERPSQRRGIPLYVLFDVVRSIREDRLP